MNMLFGRLVNLQESSIFLSQIFLDMDKQRRLQARKRRVRSQIHGSAARPRASVFLSNKNAFVQVIDDDAGKTLVSAHTFKGKAMNKEVCTTLGSDLAEKMKKAGITTIVFDRNGKQFHGRVAAIAEALRTNGIIF